MALTFDASPPPAGSSVAVNPAKLRDEIHRLSQRLVRSQESYNQDVLSGDPEVPLDEQLATIESYRARLEIVTEQLRQHEGGAALPAPQVPEQPSPIGVQQPSEPDVQAAQLPEPRVPQPPAPAEHRAPPTGPGIVNPDGTPVVGDGGSILRTEEAAMGEYVRHVAAQRWRTATGRSAGDEYDAICDGILAALAHKHGVSLEDERRMLARQVEARYRRDYG